MAEKFNFDFENIDEETNDFVGSNKPTEGKYQDDFVTFWRSSGMLGIRKINNTEKDGVMFTFMQGEGNKDPKQNTYKKDTRTMFSVEKEELFDLIHRCDEILAAAKANQLATKYSLTHKYKEETKTLNIAQSEKNPNTVFAGITKGSDRISIMMSVKDFEYFVFSLKMILYEIYVGSRVGFTVNWM